MEQTRFLNIYIYNKHMRSVFAVVAAEILVWMLDAAGLC